MRIASGMAAMLAGAWLAGVPAAAQVAAPAKGIATPSGPEPTATPQVVALSLTHRIGRPLGQDVGTSTTISLKRQVEVVLPVAVKNDGQSFVTPGFGSIGAKTKVEGRTRPIVAELTYTYKVRASDIWTLAHSNYNKGAVAGWPQDNYKGLDELCTGRLGQTFALPEYKGTLREQTTFRLAKIYMAPELVPSVAFEVPFVGRLTILCEG